MCCFEPSACGGVLRQPRDTGTLAQALPPTRRSPTPLSTGHPTQPRPAEPVKHVPVRNEAVRGPACARWLSMFPGARLRAPRLPTGSRWGAGMGRGRRRIWFKEETEEAVMLRHVVRSLMFSERALGQHEAAGGHSAHQHARNTIFQV